MWLSHSGFDIAGEAEMEKHFKGAFTKARAKKQAGELSALVEKATRD